MNQQRIGVYPGTFDPITKGHMDVIMRSQKVVDELIIGISTAYSKSPMFSVEQRVDMVQQAIASRNITNVKVEPFGGLLVDFAKETGASVIIRGLRAVSDFEYEFTMSCMNSRLNRDIETIFLPAAEENQFISSKLVKEIASLQGDISGFVDHYVAEKVYESYKFKQAS